MSLLKSIVMFIIWLVIIPFVMGILPGFMFERNKKRIGTLYMSGWIFMTAIFQLIALPFIIKMQAFSYLVFCYKLVVAVISIISLLFLIVRIGTNSFVDFIEFPTLKKMEKKEYIYWGIFAVIILVQILAGIFYMTPDGDDSYYITHAVIADVKDTMYTENAYTGVYNNLEYRHVLAPWSMFIAFIARELGVHATVVAHTLLQPVLIILTYLIFYKICQALLPNENEKQSIFMIILSMIILFGATSVYTREIFFLSRTWQGKSVLANVIIPFAFYLILQLCRQTEKGEIHRYRLVGIYFLIGLVNISGALMSSLGLLLLLVFEFAMYIVIAIRNKNLIIPIAGIPTLIPCCVYMLLYMVMK